MSQPEKYPGSRVLGPEDPPEDFSREDAAYKKVEERLVRDHLGKLALVHDDEFVGVFDKYDDALLEGYRRFGFDKVMIRVIRDPSEPPDFISLVDVNHPSIRKVD